MAMREHLFDSGEERLIKGLYPRPGGGFDRDMAVDASTYAAFYFGLYEPGEEIINGTMKAIMERLRSGGSGGIARYEGDEYYRSNPSVPGNPWVICTLWVAQWIIAAARSPSDLRGALEIISEVCGWAGPSGVLPEQVDPVTGYPLSASPLTWSHATLVTTVLEYLDKLQYVEESY